MTSTAEQAMLLGRECARADREGRDRPSVNYYSTHSRGIAWGLHQAFQAGYEREVEGDALYLARKYAEAFPNG